MSSVKWSLNTNTNRTFLFGEKKSRQKKTYVVRSRAPQTRRTNKSIGLPVEITRIDKETEQDKGRSVRPPFSLGEDEN